MHVKIKRKRCKDVCKYILFLFWEILIFDLGIGFHGINYYCLYFINYIYKYTSGYSDRLIYFENINFNLP